MQNGWTELHVNNDDSYNLLNDKTVQIHKASKRKDEWLGSAFKNADPGAEERFNLLPKNGLPTVSSKVLRSVKPVAMSKMEGRHRPIINLVTNEVIQLRPELVDPSEERTYDKKLDGERLLGQYTDLRKHGSFGREEDRWLGHQSYLGHLYDTRKANRFGAPRETSLDADKAKHAIEKYVKPKVVNQRSFDSQVVRNMDDFEMRSRSPSIQGVHDRSPEALR